MSTFCRIAIEYPNNTFESIYCNYDGYFNGGVGETLVEHYNITSKVIELIHGGNISSLGEKLYPGPGKHDKYNRQEGVTCFYHRDFGESLIEQKLEVSKDFEQFQSEYKDYDWIYIWNIDNEKWTCYRKWTEYKY